MYAVQVPLFISYILVIWYYNGTTKCATCIRYIKTWYYCHSCSQWVSVNRNSVLY